MTCLEHPKHPPYWNFQKVFNIVEIFTKIHTIQTMSALQLCQTKDKTQYEYLYNTTDTSMKHTISLQSTQLLLSCTYKYLK